MKSRYRLDTIKEIENPNNIEAIRKSRLGVWIWNSRLKSPTNSARKFRKSKVIVVFAIQIIQQIIWIMQKVKRKISSVVLLMLPRFLNRIKERITVRMMLIIRFTI